MMLRDTAAENILERLSDLENYPKDALAPYEEFLLGGKSYYFTPGGFLYRKEPGSEEVGGSSVATLPMKSGTTDPTTASQAPPLKRGGLSPSPTTQKPSPPLSIFPSHDGRCMVHMDYKKIADLCHVEPSAEDHNNQYTYDWAGTSRYPPPTTNPSPVFFRSSLETGGEVSDDSALRDNREHPRSY